MWNVELQLIWLVTVCLPAGISVCRKSRGDGLSREWMLRLAGCFLVWNLMVGLLRNSEALGDYYTIEFLAGSLLLPVYLVTLWLVCRRDGASRVLILTVAWSGLAAAVAGILWWWLVQTVDEPGARLRNPLVHGGQHPVGTAISIGFSAVATAVAYGEARTRRGRLIFLGMLAAQMLAVMLTLSRGALLALACAPLALLVFLLLSVLFDLFRGLPLKQMLKPLRRGWSRIWPPLLTVIVVFRAFHLIAPLLTPVNFTQEEATGGAPAYSTTTSILTDSPAKEYLARADSGRLNFYKFGLSCMDSWDKHLTGAGLWGPEIKLKEAMGGIDHLHSLVVATYVHGGVIGSAVMLCLVGLGLGRACILSRHGHPEWLVMLGFGLGALIFDGQSACSLVTHPRFENLILWFPLVAIAAHWRKEQERQEARQPSSSASR